MKMKKFFGTMAMAALVAGTPATFTSCDEDDVNTIIEIIDALLTTDDLNGTTWANYQTAGGEQYIALLIGFGNGQVELYEDSYTDSEGNAKLQSGTYTLDTTNNTLTLTLDTGTRRYTITEFTKGSSMTITSGNKTIRLVPYTAQ
jgi:hypothetical protein